MLSSIESKAEMISIDFSLNYPLIATSRSVAILVANPSPPVILTLNEVKGKNLILLRASGTIR